jgi:hypothetical protein
LVAEFHLVFTDILTIANNIKKRCCNKDHSFLIHSFSLVIRPLDKYNHQPVAAIAVMLIRKGLGHFF